MKRKMLISLLLLFSLSGCQNIDQFESKQSHESNAIGFPSDSTIVSHDDGKNNPLSSDAIEKKRSSEPETMKFSSSLVTASPDNGKNFLSTSEPIVRKQTSEPETMNSSSPLAIVSQDDGEDDSSSAELTTQKSTPLQSMLEFSPWNHYTIRFNRYASERMFNIWPEKFWNSYLRLSVYSDNDEWVEMINDALYSSQYAWIDEEIATSCHPDYPVIHCFSDRYLSSQTFLYSPGASFVSQIREACTIDLRTGKQVLLDDLIEVNYQFVEALKSADILVDFGEKDFYGGAAGAKVWLSTIPDDRLMEMLQECSKTPYDYPDEKNFYHLFRKSTFYLENGRIVLFLVEHESSYRNFTVDIDKIEEFLKVPKW